MCWTSSSVTHFAHSDHFSRLADTNLSCQRRARHYLPVQWLRSEYPSHLQWPDPHTWPSLVIPQILQPHTPGSLSDHPLWSAAVAFRSKLQMICALVLLFSHPDWGPEAWLKRETNPPLSNPFNYCSDLVILVLSSTVEPCWSWFLTCFSPNSFSVGLLWFFLHLLCIPFDESECCWWGNAHFHIPPSLIRKERVTAQLTNGLILNLQIHCTFRP